MSLDTFKTRMAENVPGRYYVGDQCLDCDLCRTAAPANFARNVVGRYAYVSKQPENPDEEARCREAMGGCCTDTIFDDGDRYDWAAYPAAVPQPLVPAGQAVGQETEEQELCTQCLVGNHPGSTFCRQCGAPLSAYAATGPFESLFAEGHVYRRAAEQPRRLIVVAGMWVIFGLMAVAGALCAFMSWGSESRLGVLVGIGLLAISMVLIGKTTRNYRNRAVTKREKSE